MRTPAYEKKIAIVVAAQNETNSMLLSRIGSLERTVRWLSIVTVAIATALFLAVTR